MKRFTLLSVLLFALFIIGCDKQETTPLLSDLTGTWQNVSDTYDVFTFNADKSGSYAYRYIDATDANTGAITYFPTSESESYDFDYYTLEYNGSSYDLTFYGSPFPITNATMYMLDGYLHIKYDWSDYRGKEWFDVIELYEKID